MKTRLMYKLKFLPTLIIVLLIIVAIIYSPQASAKGVRDGLSISAQIVIPSLFPFIVLSTFIVKSGLAVHIGSYLERITLFFFNLPSVATSVIVMSLLGGYPIGAKMTADLLSQGLITENQAQRMMMFCVNAGPAFIIGAVGSAMLNNQKAGLILYASLTISSLSMGIITGLFSRNEEYISPSPKKLNISLSNALVNSVSESCSTMLSICSWVILFSCMNSLVSILEISTSAMLAIKCVFEVTTGCSQAVGIVSLPVIAAILGWSGLSVHFQIMPYVLESGIKPMLFFSTRVINGALAAVICYELLNIYPIELSAFSTNVSPVTSFFSSSAPAAAGLMMMGGMLILLSTQKVQPEG